MNVLKNINIEIISLVGKAANGRVVICKSNFPVNGDSNGIERTIKIIKSDAMKKKIYGIVYSPVGVDKQGDTATAEEIEKASDNFMLRLNSTNKVDTNHNLNIEPGVNIVENWIVRKGDELFPNDIGAWAIGVKVNDDSVWQRIEKGELTGFSMYGTAIREENIDSVKKNDTEEAKKMSNMKEVLNNFINIFKSKKMNEGKEIKIIKDFNALVEAKDANDYIYVLRDAIDSIYEDEAITDKKTAVATCIDQFKEKVTAINVAKGIANEVMTDGEIDIAKAGKVLSEENLKKLQAAIDSINSLIASAKGTGTGTDTTVAKSDEIEVAVRKAVEEMKVELEKAQVEVAAVKKEYEDFKKKSNGSEQSLTDMEKSEAKEPDIFPWV